MAIYHLSVKTVSRAKGRSATAAAAYRAGVEIVDERTGEVHDYSRKTGVVHSEIILPNGADPKFEDRTILWNETEKSEKRKNSTVAREYEVHLPHELSADEREALAREYGEWLAERFGVGVDVAIHEPNREGDQRNHHAHILTTTRQIEGDELTSKTRELDEKKSGAVEEVREKWADLANVYLERIQHKERLDHRSYERQGREEVPTIHLGPKETAKERRGETTVRGNINRVVMDARSAAREALKLLKAAKDKIMGGFNLAELGALTKQAESERASEKLQEQLQQAHEAIKVVKAAAEREQKNEPEQKKSRTDPEHQKNEQARTRDDGPDLAR